MSPKTAQNEPKKPKTAPKNGTPPWADVSMEQRGETTRLYSMKPQTILVEASDYIVSSIIHSIFRKLNFWELKEKFP